MRRRRSRSTHRSGTPRPPCTRFRFRLATAQGAQLLDETELLLERDISYTETAALAKEAEEALQYRDMQRDITQQVMRRLAAVTAP